MAWEPWVPLPLELELELAPALQDPALHSPGASSSASSDFAPATPGETPTRDLGAWWPGEGYNNDSSSHNDSYSDRYSGSASPATRTQRQARGKHQQQDQQQHHPQQRPQQQLQHQKGRRHQHRHQHQHQHHHNDSRGTTPHSQRLQRRDPRLAFPPSPFSPASSSSPSPQAPSPPPSASPSHQQEPGAAGYLERLLRVVQCACAAPREREMGDFLAAFNFAGDDAIAPEPSACNSIEELQLRLHEVLDAKTSPTRAEHVVTTLDVGPAAQLTLAVSQTENDALEGLTNVDPSLAGGVAPAGLPAGLTRTVKAFDAIINQPQNDPVLQRAIAKHIIAAVTATDGSTWVMREMSRASQGWTFTYQCKDSTQQWERHNKGKAKHAIAEFTNKEPDQVVSGRPAFDCRGSVEISFSRDNRAISVSYTHTPLHRTVAEISELFRPPPREVVAPKPTKQKTPKTSGSAKKRSAPRSQDETGTPKKRKKKNNGEGQASAATDEQAPGQVAQNGGEAAGANGLLNSQTAIEPTAPGSFPVNVTPEEATRRREFANKLLSDSGVDPDSLSTDQFTIFANQSPDLQKESLNMLMKYGAERLRIVHPSNRDTSASASPGTSTAPGQASQNIPSEPTTTKELVPQSHDIPTKERKGRKLGKSRNACFRCKERKVKCPRERPDCTECQTEGLECEYAPQKPRKKKSKADAKSDAVVPADYDAESDDAADDEAVQDETMHDDQVDEVVEEDADEADGDDVDQVEYSGYPQVPVADMLTASADVQNHATHGSSGPYFQSGSGLAMPMPDDPSVHQPLYTAGSGLVLPQGTMYYPPPMEPAVDTSALHVGAPAAKPTMSSPELAKQQAKNSRRILPSGQAGAQARNSPPVYHSTASAWASSVGPNNEHQAAPTTSPSMQQQRATSKHRSRGSDPRITTNALPLQDAAAALSQAALEHQRQSPVANMALLADTARAASAQSFENPRAASRQALRAQAGTSRGARGARSAFQPPPMQQQQQQASEPAAAASAAAGHRRTGSTSMNSSSNNSAAAFLSFGRHTEQVPAVSSSSERITYEPYSYAQRTAPASSGAYPAYDYGYSAATSTQDMQQQQQQEQTNLSSHATNPTTAALSAASRASNNASPGAGRSSYSSPRGFNAQPSRQGARSSLGQRQQQQPQQQPQQQQQQQQQQSAQSHHNQSWFGGFGNSSHNNSGANGNARRAPVGQEHQHQHQQQQHHHQQHSQQQQQHGYGWKMTTDHW